ncbi:hypothetical protein ACQR1Y_01575 [Bradyrhizobium sp. HKCCYLRH3099]|uniref:hypothetical protein n=1 Tax=unclassified Bradyrhizobium TaxID=2631580 RepID=UPI003EB6EF2B
MRLLFWVTLLGALAVGTGISAANETCGPGCHVAPNGGCVVNGWEVGAPVWNECPAGARPRPPCGAGFRWSRQARACLMK